MTDFFASRHSDVYIHCEDYKSHEAPLPCRDAHSDAVNWSSASSFVSNSILSFALVSLCVCLSPHACMFMYTRLALLCALLCQKSPSPHRQEQIAMYISKETCMHASYNSLQSALAFANLSHQISLYRSHQLAAAGQSTAVAAHCESKHLLAPLSHQSITERKIQDIRMKSQKSVTY